MLGGFEVVKTSEKNPPLFCYGVSWMQVAEKLSCASKVNQIQTAVRSIRLWLSSSGVWQLFTRASAAVPCIPFFHEVQDPCPVTRRGAGISLAARGWSLLQLECTEGLHAAVSRFDSALLR